MRIALSALLTISAALAQGPPPGRGAGRMGFDAPHFDAPQGPGARFLGAEAGMSGRTVKNAPYSADVVTESTQTLSDGNRIRQSSTAKLYRDSDGRTRREQSLNLSGLSPNSNMPQLIFINDPVAGVNFALNATDRTGTKSVRNQRAGGGGGGGPRPRQGDAQSAEPDRNPADRNMKTEPLGHQTMEGLAVEGRRTTLIIPAGQMGNEMPIQIVTETWFSADLQLAVLTKRSDPRNGETLTKLTNLSRTEPSHLIFEVPADYKVTEAASMMPRPRSPGQTK
jgi:hypothetical protein